MRPGPDWLFVSRYPMQPTAGMQPSTPPGPAEPLGPPGMVPVTPSGPAAPAGPPGMAPLAPPGPASPTGPPGISPLAPPGPAVPAGPPGTAAHTVPSAATHGGGGWVTKLPVLPNAAGASAIALAATPTNSAGAAALLVLFRMTNGLPSPLDSNHSADVTGSTRRCRIGLLAGVLYCTFPRREVLGVYQRWNVDCAIWAISALDESKVSAGGYAIPISAMLRRYGCRAGDPVRRIAAQAPRLAVRR